MSRAVSLFFVFLAAYCLSYFFRSTNAVIADELVRDIQLTADQLGLITGVFFAVFALAQLVIGPALDRFGARRTTSLLMLSTVAGSLIFSGASSLLGLVLGRGLIGLGMAGVLMGSLKAFGAWFPPQRFATISGLFVALGTSGAIFATSPLELFSSHYGWRMVFITGAVITLFSSALIFFLTRDHPGDAAPVTSVKQGSALMILKDRRFWPLALFNFALAGGFFAYQSLWMGPFLTDVVGTGSRLAGQLLLLLNVASAFGFLLSGYLADRYGLRIVILMAGIFFLIQLGFALFGAQLPISLLAVSQVIFGFCGAVGVVLFAHVRSLYPDYLAGRALAFVNLFGIGGAAVLQWLLGIVIRLYPLTEAGTYAPAAFTTVFMATALFGAVSLLIYSPLTRQSLRPAQVSR
jgi:MFS family permease